MAKRLKNVEVTRDNVDQMLRSVRALTDVNVLVGIPASSAPRDSEEGKAAANNAMIGYVMENGSPAQNIPARPFLLPGVRDARSKLVVEFKRIAKMGITLSPIDVSDQYYRIGIVAQNSVRMKITNGPFVPLAEATIKARLRRHPRRKAEKLALKLINDGQAGMGNYKSGWDVGGFVERPMISSEVIRPLMDTGQLRAAITFVIRRKSDKEPGT